MFAEGLILTAAEDNEAEEEEDEDDEDEDDGEAPGLSEAFLCPGF